MDNGWSEIAPEGPGTYRRVDELKSDPPAQSWLSHFNQALSGGLLGQSLRPLQAVPGVGWCPCCGSARTTFHITGRKGDYGDVFGRSMASAALTTIFG